MSLSAKQRRSIIEATAPVNIWHGSIRSGKTFASISAFALWLHHHAPKDGEIAIIGRTTDSVRRNILAPLRRLHRATCTYSDHKTTAQVMGRQVHLFGVNDKTAEEKIRGLTLAGAYVDEVTTIDEAFFVQTLGRLSVPGHRLFGTTNPDNPRHWLKTNYLDKAGELGWATWHFTMADNPSLQPEYIAAKHREFTGMWHDRFILGLWCSAEGAVYDMWDETKHVVAWHELPLMRALLAVGVDYGTTNASAGILLGLGKDHRLYAVDEWADITRQGEANSTDWEQAASLEAWLGAPHLPQDTPMRPRHVIIDPSAASFKAQLLADRVKGLTAANNAVADGIRNVASLLATGDLIISDRCTNLIREIPSYVWDTKASKRGEDRPVKKDDHFCDALRYAVHTTEPLWRPHIQRREEQRREAHQQPGLAAQGH